ncbi:translation initiation factor IF-2 [Striga asiatica]|uniref:Translation initiation factor IF-2 n=1 Tax=Striga asiatica TaxID=4170 RepID=A0A5A7P3W0_STRAF|nr:translation initiation factor IF-2 [Striga asiatica]
MRNPPTMTRYCLHWYTLSVPCYVEIRSPLTTSNARNLAVPIATTPSAAATPTIHASLSSTAACSQTLGNQQQPASPLFPPRAATVPAFDEPTTTATKNRRRALDLRQQRAARDEQQIPLRQQPPPDPPPTTTSPATYSKHHQPHHRHQPPPALPQPRTNPPLHNHRLQLSPPPYSLSSQHQRCCQSSSLMPSAPSISSLCVAIFGVQVQAISISAVHLLSVCRQWNTSEK